MCHMTEWCLCHNGSRVWALCRMIKYTKFIQKPTVGSPKGPNLFRLQHICMRKAQALCDKQGNCSLYDFKSPLVWHITEQ